MKILRHYLLTAICLLAVSAVGMAQGEDNTEMQLPEGPKELSLPKVFQIGEYEEQYGLLYEVYHDILLSVCHDDMELAFDKWMHMLVEMEDYAQRIDFDLNGVKIWLKVFWDEDGTIRYLSYYRKPNSRNVDPADLSAFLTSFLNYYQMPITSTVKYTHNGSAQFPTTLIPAEVRRTTRN